MYEIMICPIKQLYQYAEDGDMRDVQFLLLDLHFQTGLKIISIVSRRTELYVVCLFIIEICIGLSSNARYAKG